MKLNVWAFGLTCALIWGLGLFAVTWWIIAFDGQTGEMTMIGRFQLVLHNQDGIVCEVHSD